MHLIALPAFNDNYIWMLHDTHRALVVDPGDAAPVLQALKERQLSLQAIVVTHHHGDHCGGLAQLCQATAAPVWGPAHESLPVPCTPVREGDTWRVLGLPVQVLDVPGHTAGHVAYHLPHVPVDSGECGLLFCGDTLFSGGCGRVFEGTPAQMLASLDRLNTLPANTCVCCAHEYTLSNLRFAQAVEPDNAELTAYAAWCAAQRAQGLPTLPSTLARERGINPFLRVRVPAVAAAARRRDASAHTDAQCFAALREWKNQFS